MKNNIKPIKHNKEKARFYIEVMNNKNECCKLPNYIHNYSNKDVLNYYYCNNCYSIKFHPDDQPFNEQESTHEAFSIEENIDKLEKLTEERRKIDKETELIKTKLMAVINKNKENDKRKDKLKKLSKNIYTKEINDMICPHCKKNTIYFDLPCAESNEKYFVYDQLQGYLNCENCKQHWDLSTDLDYLLDEIENEINDEIEKGLNPKQLTNWIR